jgi:hypothetical protein
MDWEKEKVDSELQFNRVKALKEQAEASAKQLEQQLFQLQGRHALICEMIAKEQAEVVAKQPKPTADARSKGASPN